MDGTLMIIKACSAVQIMCAKLLYAMSSVVTMNADEAPDLEGRDGHMTIDYFCFEFAFLHETRLGEGRQRHAGDRLGGFLHGGVVDNRWCHLVSIFSSVF